MKIDDVCVELDEIKPNSKESTEIQVEIPEHIDDQLESDELDQVYETYTEQQMNCVPIINFLERYIGTETLDSSGKAFPWVYPLIVLFLALCIAIYPFLLINLQSNNPGVWDYNREELRDIYLTKEYQLILDPKIFTPRDIGVNEILKVFAECSGLDVENTTKKHIGIRSQFKYNPWNCTNWQDIDRFEYSEYMSALYYQEHGHGYYNEYGELVNTTNHDEVEYVSDTELRVRNWISVRVGDNIHTSTIDIKKQVSNMTEALNFGFQAAPDQIDGSTEKLEQDIITSKYKWSHKSKVSKVPYYPSFETCADVIRYWPNAFPNLRRDKYNLGVERKTKSENYWYEDLRESVDPRSGLKWRLTLTMEYETFPQALEGRISPLESPEISLRIWSSENGRGPWDPRIVSKVNQWYVIIDDAFT